MRIEIVQNAERRGDRFFVDLVSVVPVPPDDAPPADAPPPPSSRSTVFFDGWLIEGSGGVRLRDDAGFGPYEEVKLPDGARASVETDGPLYPGTSYVRVRLPSGAERAELAEDDSETTDAERSVPEGGTTYVPFAFRYPVAPDSGGWGHLVMQAKSWISNVKRTPPQIRLHFDPDKDVLELGASGGDYRERPTRWEPILSPRPGTWYRGVLGVRFEPDDSGWARVWLSPAGAPLPAEGAPTARIEQHPTTYFAPNESDPQQARPPNFFRIGAYHDTGHGDMTLDTIGFKRVDSYAAAVDQFQARE